MIDRDQYAMWAQMFAGTTVRDLRHIRDVPRAALPLRRIARPSQIPLRRSEPMFDEVRIPLPRARPPLHELDETPLAAART